MQKHFTEVVERIVIDYANLSGRESSNRAEFRKKTEENLQAIKKDLLKIADAGEYEDMRREVEEYFNKK